MEEILHFKVSSGLKNIIGRELINDKYIAIFELVKNSYDAGAHSVTIKFENLDSPDSSITISDDGSGMSKEDIINKWLFVAYSEKRNPSYRDRIKRSVAGAKGVGRFSCDRLGEEVTLISKVEKETYGHKISINWNDFEQNSLDNFADIDVKYAEDSSLTSSGTCITIYNLRETWIRSDLLALKKALSQLVNPSATTAYDPFEILLQVPNEEENDENETEDRNKVNGKVCNNIFDILNRKTTKIVVNISEDGKKLTTELNDRGTYLFKTIEKNEFSLRNVSCTLFNLNRSAKVSFTRSMGVEAINYGSIFVYKNGFRVNPYGEPGQDFFYIDQRKQQGFMRYLGTRDLIGQIEITGETNDLIETSSRNNGFINSAHLTELKTFFLEYVLKPLEKYVVNITQWGDTDNFLDSAIDNAAFNDISSIIKKVKPRSKEESYISIEFNHDLPQIILGYKSEVSIASKELRKLAANSNDDNIIKKAKEVERHTQNLEKRVREATHEAETTQERLEESAAELSATIKQVGLMTARADLTAQDAIDALHIMKGYADAIDSVISEIYEVAEEEKVDFDVLNPYLSRISQICEKIMKSYNLVMRTNYSAGSDTSHNDIIRFISDYLETSPQPVHVTIDNSKDVKGLVKFNPLEFCIVLDNIISNSQKANASNITFSFDKYSDGIIMRCSDDGYGLKSSVNEARIFEAGYTTTVGTGIGLSTVKKYIEKVGGRVEYNPKYKDGFELILYLK